MKLILEKHITLYRKREICGIKMKIVKSRRGRIEKFLNFIIKNKDKYGWIQMCALFGVMTGLSTFTIDTYSRQLIDCGAVKIEEDKVAEIINIFEKKT